MQTQTRVVSFHYTLTDRSGVKLDSSAGGPPLNFLEGSGQIIPGLEEQLIKLAAGDKKKIDVTAAAAYGPRNEELVIKMPKDKLPKPDIAVGDQFQTMQDGAPFVFTVVDMAADKVTLDGNHPLAGVDLTFDVEVLEIRNATQEELQHGHSHGGDGHHHH